MNAPERPAHFAERTAPLHAQPVDVLPAPARDLLVLASQLSDPHERRVAIDHAIERVKARFPELFQQE